MNVFVLSTDPAECAKMHCDKHVVKMCVEYAQLLSTSARMMGFEHAGYRSTHGGHPCTKWAASSDDNWSWLYRLAQELGAEYSLRYGRVHASTTALQLLPERLVTAAVISKVTPAHFALAMPEQYYTPDAVEAYRSYYRGEKQHFATYRSPSTKPTWLN